MVRLYLAAEALDLEVVRALSKAIALGIAFQAERLLLGDGDGEALAALGAAALEDLTALVRLHPLAKAMGALAPDVAGLVGPLAHERSP